MTLQTHSAHSTGSAPARENSESLCVTAQLVRISFWYPTAYRKRYLRNSQEKKNLSTKDTFRSHMIIISCCVSSVPESVSKYPLPFGWVGRGEKTLNSMDLYLNSTMSITGDFCLYSMEYSLVLSWLSERPLLIGHSGTTEITVPTRGTRMYGWTELGILLKARIQETDKLPILFPEA